MKTLFKAIKLIFVEPDTLVSKYRQRVLNNRQRAFSSRWPNLPTNVLFDDAADDAEPPQSPAEAIDRLRANRLGLAIAGRLQQRLAMRILLVLIALGFMTAASAAIPIIGIIGGAHTPAYLMLAAAVSWTTISALALYFLVFQPTAATALMLPKKPLLAESDIDDADAFTKRVLVHPVTDDTPADLQDRLRILSVDASGEPVDGQVLPADYRESYLQTVLDANWIFYLGLVIGGIFVVPAAWAATITQFSNTNNILAGSSIVGLGFGATILALLAVIALARLLVLPNVAEKRATLAQRAMESAPSARLVEEFGREAFQLIETARTKQRERATQDSSPFVALGTSTGILAARRDGFAPTEIVPFGLSTNDLSTHLLTLGATGTGKTAGVLRPLLTHWLDNDSGGVLVLDGKGALPRELADDPRFSLITPDSIKYNPIAGLTPDDVANTLYEQNASGDSEAAFFEQSAMRMLRSSAVVLELLCKRSDDWHWTLGNLYRIAGTVRGLKAAQTEITPDDFADYSEHEQRHLSYRFTEYPDLPDRTRGSIDGHVQAWLSSITDTEQLAAWVDCVESQADITSVLKGNALAFDLPEAVYGPAGPALSAMIKSQLYRAIKIRGDFATAHAADDSETPVLVMIDECQEIISSDDAAMLPIARSLGVRSAMATQAVDGLYERLGENGCDALLAQFRSVVALDVSSTKTREFVSERMGTSYRSSCYTVTSNNADALALQVASTRTPGGFTKGSQGFETVWRSNLNHEMRVTAGIGSDLGAGLRQMTKGPLGELAQSLPMFRQTRDNPATHQISKERNVTADEISTLTSAPFCALASINRGGVPRRDVIQLSPMFAFEGAAQ